MFSQIKVGFFHGIGFSIALCLGLFIISSVISNMFDEMYSDFEDGDYIEFDSAIELKAKYLSYSVKENNATILGVIENNTDYQWKDTAVEVEFYLGEVFVKECSTQITTKIPSNTKENFEFSCESCEDECSGQAHRDTFLRECS